MRMSSHSSSASAMWTPAIDRQERQRVRGVVDPSGGVDPGPEDEADPGRADGAQLQPAAIDERPYADQRRAVQRVESRTSEDAIGAAERDDVGDRGERAELHELAA